MANTSIDQDEIPAGEDYKLRPQTPEEKERLNPDDSDVPTYRIQLNTTKEQEDKITEQFKMEFKAREDEIAALGLAAKWKERDAQYDGDMDENPLIPFNLHVHQSKIKTDAIARGMKEGFLDSDPVADISPRPETSRKDGQKVAQRLMDYLDYAMDEEVKPDIPIDKIIKQAIKKYVGLGKISWGYRQEKRRREESYEGKAIPVQVVGNRTIVKNEGLEQFLKVYPDGMDKYKGYVRKLMEGKRIDIVVNYNDTVENNVKLQSIKVEDFFVRNGCDYNEGLRTEHFIGERQVYTYWDLKKKEEQEEFKNIEALYSQAKDDGSSVSYDEGYKTKEYNVIEATMYVELDEGEGETKIKAWFSEDKKTFLGAILYPYYAFDTDYIGFWAEINEYGFYGNARSVMFALRDSNLAQNVLLNLALYAFYLRNSMTPIVQEGSETEKWIANNDIRPGKPIIVETLTDDVRKGIDFVQWPQMDLNSCMALMELLRRDDSDTVKVSDLTSGRESAVDPHAPASKTLALLEQSGLGVKEYIRTMLPSFNIFFTMFFQLSYQMNQEGRKYQVRRKSEGVTGEDAFGTISRDDLIMKTNVQARASAFVFDKVSEKQEAAAGLNISMTHPEFLKNPEAMHNALIIFLNTLGQQWRNLADKLPTGEQFQQKQMQVAVQAMQQLMAQAAQQKANTGVAPQISPQMAGDAVTKAQMLDYNPKLAQPAGAAQ